MKKLVVYYSLEGNTKLIAEALAEAASADLMPLIPKKDISSSNKFMKFLWGGKQIMMKEKPELLPFDKDVSEYDMIFIGTPVWAWSYAPALATFFELSNLQNKKVALFCCSGGGKGKTFEKMKTVLKNNEIIGEIDFIEPLKHDSAQDVEKAKKWVEGLAI